MSRACLRFRVGAVAATLIAFAAGAATAAGAPLISGGDGDVWNTTNAPPVYTITGSEPGASVWWGLAPGGRLALGDSPVTVRLDGLADGRYQLFAYENGPGRADLASRTFLLDATPPTVLVTTPALGAAYALGATAVADYSCDGANRCVGTVLDGAALDTTTAGIHPFTVTASDTAGNAVTVARDYTVTSPPAAPPSAPPPSSPVVSPAPEPTPTTTGSGGTQPLQLKLPALSHAERLKPRRGATVATTRPTLRWKARKHARLYNVQVFRVQGTRFVKVLSVFPRGTHLRVPARRLRAGAAHVWRVWPMVGDSFTKKPLGVSYFAVSARPR
jgi:hypothetical protein